MAEFIAPPIPPLPAADATWHEWDVYLRCVRENNRMAEHEMQAAMLRDVALIPESKAKMTRGELAAALIPLWPHTRRQTETTAVDEVAATVNAFAAKYPGTLVD